MQYVQRYCDNTIERQLRGITVALFFIFIRPTTKVQVDLKSITSILDERVSFKIKATSKTAKICQTDLCNNETNLSDLDKFQEFVSSDMAVFAFVNLGTVSNRVGATDCVRVSLKILGNMNYKHLSYDIYFICYKTTKIGITYTI